MLKSIHIYNYTIIKEITLSFSPGLTIITGETGTGKSIIIDALGFSLGEKKRGGTKTEFFIASIFVNCRSTLKRYGIDDEKIIFRSESKERIRYYLNDSLTPQKVINEIGRNLVDIIGGYSHQSFFSAAVQLELLDNFAGIKSYTDSFSKTYKELYALNEELESLKKEIEEIKRTEEFTKWEMESIERINPSIDEDREIEDRLKVLENSEKLLEITSEAYSILDGDGGIEETLTRVLRLVGELARIDNKNKPLAKRLEDICYELKDISASLSSYMDKIDLNTDEIEKIRMRVMELKELKKRFGGSIENVIKKKEELKKRLKGLSVNEDEKNRLEREMEKLKKETEQMADLLSGKRRETVDRFCELIKKEFADLELEKARFDIRITPCKMQETGRDTVEFLFSANPGQKVEPLSSVASRGELSRCMLALKKVLADADKVPTLIFDEIDVGVSGRIADAVGDKLKEISKTHQVICITHLPQIAAKGDRHINVEKIIKNGRTSVFVKELSGREREEQIAQLIAGKKVTETARRHAKTLLGDKKFNPHSKNP